MFINRSPGGSIRTSRHGDRYEFLNATAPQVIEVLKNIIKVIREKTIGKVKVILTVSPVPLHGTFTDWDVVSANAYSKATLLSSAVTVALSEDDVDYFPSYEMVTMANPKITWEDDGIHVKRPLIEKVLEVFMKEYVK